MIGVRIRGFGKWERKVLSQFGPHTNWLKLFFKGSRDGGRRRKR